MGLFRVHQGAEVALGWKTAAYRSVSRKMTFDSLPGSDFMLVREHIYQRMTR